MSIDNVMRLFLAGREEAPVQTAQEPEGDTKTVAPDAAEAVEVRYLTFTVGNKIEYDKLVDLVKESGDQALKDLKNNHGGNFNWTKAILYTNSYTTRPIANGEIFYDVDISDNAKAGTSRRVLSKDGRREIVHGMEGVAGAEDQDTLVDTLNKKVFDAGGKIKFDGNVFFIKVNEGFDISKIMASVIRGKGKSVPGSMDLNTFTTSFGSGNVYRMWDADKNMLVTPLLEDIAKKGLGASDNFIKPGTPFLGTEDNVRALEQLVKKEAPGKPGQPPAPAPGQPVQPQQPAAAQPQQPSAFEPVDEQQGRFGKMAKNIVDSKIEEYKEEDPDANYYHGDFSVMQDLVKRQHKKMKIRKHAQSSTDDLGQIKLPVKLNQPGIDKAEKDLKNLEKAVNDATKATQTYTQTTSPYSKNASVDRVIDFFLKD